MKITWVPTEKNILSIPAQIKKVFQIQSDTVIVHFGAWNKEMVVREDNQLPAENIGLPEDLPIYFQIPNELNYEIRVEGNHFHIGPVIGFIPYTTNNKLTQKRLEVYKDRLANYDKIGGLIFVSTPKKINLLTKTIDGYYYTPNGPHGQAKWVPGRFPYPNAIFKRRKLNKEIHEDLEQHIGDRMFNAYLNKLSFWQVTSSSQAARPFVPYTEEFTHLNQLNNFLQKYETVYLKPRTGSQGRGIMMVKRGENGKGYIFTNNKQSQSVLTDWNEVNDFLADKLSKKYLIQQGVPTKYSNQHVDFRVYMQKDETMKWKMQWIMGRIAKEGSIVTNLRYTSEVMSGQETLKKVFELNDENTANLMKRVEDTCIKVCQAFDSHGIHLGDIALDIIVDNDMNVWVLEINRRYQYKMIKKEPYTDIYKKIMSTPFLYAKALSGF